MKLSKKQQKALQATNVDMFFDLPVQHIETQQTVRLPDEKALSRIYDTLNYRYFDGKLPKVKIEWSSRMRIAGKCYVEHRLIKLGRKYHEYFPDEVEDTLKHEMIHILYPNHGKEFKREAERLGATRYAKEYPGGKSPHKYIYICPSCGQKYYRHRRMYNCSCGICSIRGYDPRYKLKLYWSAKSRRRSR
ncbi:MAG TPA: M48 family peptidase [candidate division Zixibacteria bacterium]|nr:M48 family peptidase [candidate division Zixibacteria bacterium]HEQ99303.1 M48 family peptidase [candidate division Zixibacteria bacterium]